VEPVQNSQSGTSQHPFTGACLAILDCRMTERNEEKLKALSILRVHQLQPVKIKNLAPERMSTFSQALVLIL